MRRAKIVATLGPSVSTPEQIRELVDAGMDVARLNLSHGTHDVHRQAYLAVRQASDASGRGVGVLVDLQGPKIRLGTFAEGRAAAASVDRYLMGTTNLPSPIRASARPLMV